MEIITFKANMKSRVRDETGCKGIFSFNDMGCLDHRMKGAERKTAEWLWGATAVTSSPGIRPTLGFKGFKSTKRPREQKSLDSLQGREPLLSVLLQS